MTVIRFLVTVCTFAPCPSIPSPARKARGAASPRWSGGSGEPRGGLASLRGSPVRAGAVPPPERGGFPHPALQLDFIMEARPPL